MTKTPKYLDDMLVSPCISVCKIDPETGYCLGCFRTLQEMNGWKKYSKAERRSLLDELRARRADHGDGPKRGKRRNRRRK